MRINVLARIVDLARRGAVGINVTAVTTSAADGILLGMVRRIISLSHKAVPWAAGDGADCPVCLEVLGARTRGRVSRTTDQVRYMECRHCGTTFKAISPAAPPEETRPSKSLENLPRKRRRK